MIESWVDSELVVNADGVYEIRGQDPIAYSDGKDVERYLARAFDSCSDLGTGSAELEQWIKDWPSEYHLSRKRAQLLNGFDYERSATVLEVGCGCGAISRFLAESFDTVISVEGSRDRARLARQRCRDMSNISIIAAPFQKVRFRKKFDIIFCIGVFEYSATFVDSPDPYSAIIEYFADHLEDNGVLVLAIENQFGLKYFAAASEDHTKVGYDGIEGYPRFPGRARTFGYREIGQLLSRQFAQIDYYFPCADYKVPDGVLSGKLFELVDAGQLLGTFRSRDYLKPWAPVFSEKLAWRELAKNAQVPFFANSFLVVAAKNSNDSVRFPDLAIIYNRDRAEAYQTRTRIYQDLDSGAVTVSKVPVNNVVSGQPAFRLQPYTEPWREGETLQHAVLRRAMDRKASFEAIFAPTRVWFDHLSALAPGAGPDASLPGECTDAIWQNTIAARGAVHLIDQEWVSANAIPLKIIVMRAVYRFLVELREADTLSGSLRWMTTAQIIVRVAGLYGLEIGKAELREFTAFESTLNSLALGKTRNNAARHVCLILGRKQQVIKWLMAISRRRAALRFYARKVVRLLSRIYHDAIRG
jgi:precorrin-6B methylase 2